MKKNYFRYYVLQAVLATVVTCIIQHQAFCQVSQQVTVGPEVIQGNSIPVTLDKPLLRAYGASLTQQESYELDALTPAERQFIESKVDPPCVGVVRELANPIVFMVKDSDIPQTGSVMVSGGRLSRIDSGLVAWTVLVESARADRLRLFFAEGNIPPGVEVNIFSREGYAFRQYDLRGKIGPYGFYTTTTFADHLILQLVIPVGEIGEMYFRIPSVVHSEEQYINRLPLTCYEDANCAYANGYTNIEGLQNSVAVIFFVESGGNYQCTGGLLNDIRAGDFQPFFLTANHCFATQAAATTLEAQFDYETLSCGGAVNTNLVIVNGSNLIAENSQTDFTLVLLKEQPGGARTYLGWSPNSLANNETVHSVHHPSALPQKYSRLQNKTAPSYTCSGRSTGNFHYTTFLGGQAWHGSSGSPLVTEGNIVRGQMLGPCGDDSDICDFSEYYLNWGRFDVSYSNNNLQYWLYGGGSSVSMSSSPSSSYNYGTVNIGSYENHTITVTNTGTVPNYLNLDAGNVTITGTNSNQFSIIGASSLYLPPNTSGTFTVRFTPTSPGMKTASFNIPHNADNITSPRTITLTGYGNPCSDLISLGGGGMANPQTFTVSGTGSWYTSTNTPCGTTAEGVEQVYSFVAPVTGTYSIEVTATNNTNVVYMWKSVSCASTGWNCIDEIYATGTYGAMNWTAGITYYLLLDDRYTSATTHSFYLFYNPCESVTSIAGTGAGYSKTYNGGGNGIWNTYSASPCFWTCPGIERVYSFTPATTGLYNVVVTAASGYVDYMWSTACASTGWTCIDDIISTGTYGSILLIAGTTYYLLLDDENTTTGAHTFYINLAEAAGNWLGMYNNDWYQTLNWSAGFVPDATINVTVNTGYTYWPVVASGDAYCNNITIGAGAKISVGAGDLNVAGNVTIFGQLEQTSTSADLNISGNIYWETGSTANITASGRINVDHDWEFRAGSTAVLANGITYFKGTATSYIRSYTASSAFRSVYNSKTSGDLFFSASSTDTLKINGAFNNVSSINDFYANAGYPIVLQGQLFNSGHIYGSNADGTFIFKGTVNSINLNTGDYFNHVIFNSSGNITIYDSLRVNGNLTINSGALVTSTHPILIMGNWTNNVGTSGFTEGTGKVVFNGGNYHQFCLSDETFYTLEVDKPLGGAFRIDGADATCSFYDWTAGAVDVLSGSFTANCLADNGLYGKYYVNTGGAINLTNNDGWIDLNGEVHVFGGNFNIWGGSGSDSYWPFAANGVVEISGGVLDIKNVGVVVQNNAYTLTENITGGTIRTSRGFTVDRADYSPSGGTVEFYGPTDGYFYTTNGNVHHVLVNKSAADQINTGSSMNVLRNENGTTSVTDAPMTNTISSIALCDINGDVTIQSGVFSASATTLYVAGSWTNHVGSSGFTEGSGTVVLNGAAQKHIYTSETFYNLDLGKTYASTGAIEVDGELQVMNNLHIIDGNMELNSPANVYITGNLTIDLNAGLNADDSYGPQIFLAGNWTNLNTTFSSSVGFTPGSTSRVVFNGSLNQVMTKSGSGEFFADLIINKSGGLFRPANNTTCYRDLAINNGGWEDNVAGLTHTVYRNFTVLPGGALFNAFAMNTVSFIGSSNSLINYGSTTGCFHHLTINKSTGISVTQATDVNCLFSGNLLIENGNFNVNGKRLWVEGDITVNDLGTLTTPAVSMVVLTNANTLNVNSGGRLDISGTAVSPVTFRADISTARYGLNVNSGGTIAADYGIFKNTGLTGVNVVSGGLVDLAHSFKGCTFQDGSAGGTLLTLNNSQTLTIRNTMFPTNAGGGATNVTKALNAGHVYFVNYSGVFSGPTYEVDAFNLIDWVPTLTATATATPGSVCAGSGSQLNVVRTGGLAPFTYLWSPSAGLSNPAIINPLANPLVTTNYSVTVTDALGTAATGSILVTVVPVLPVSMTIAASANPSPPGNFVTFTATPVNGGASPAYQWKVNGLNVGTGLSTYSYIPSYGDDVTCVITSNYACPSGNPATSNIITMIVVATNTSVTGTVSPPLNLCFDATNTITVAGGGTTFVVQPGASATMIAGMKIRYLPTTIVQPGGYMHGYITTTNNYCGSLLPSMVAVLTTTPGQPESSEFTLFSIYPNPTTGKFTLLQKGEEPNGMVTVEIFGLRGERLLSQSLFDVRKHEFNVGDLSAGLYFVKIVKGNHVETFKLVKNL